MPGSSWFVLLLFVIGAALLIFYTRIGRLLRCVLFTAFSGAVSLGLVWLAGQFTALTLAITPFSLLVSAVLGIPGVLAMLFMGLL